MKYRINKNTILEFDLNVISSFEKYKQLSGKNEAGGVLLGMVYPDRIVIDKITTPGTEDQMGFFFFKRNKKRAQNIVSEAWVTSEGERIYLGEWHTHSELHPVPSSTDRNMIRDMLRQTVMEINFLFTVIVGLEDYWVGLQKGNKLTKLIRQFEEKQNAFGPADKHELEGA